MLTNSQNFHFYFKTDTETRFFLYLTLSDVHHSATTRLVQIKQLYFTSCGKQLQLQLGRQNRIYIYIYLKNKTIKWDLLASMACVHTAGCFIDSVVIADAEYKVNTHHLLVTQEEEVVHLSKGTMDTDRGRRHKLALPQIQALKSKYSITRDLQALFFFKGFATSNL